MTDSTVQSGIGTRVRAARERLDLSREALAVNSGLSWSAIAQIESGRRRNLRPDTLFALARELALTVDYLIRGGPASPPMLDHRALLYDSDEAFVTAAGPFIAEGLERSEAAIAVTTPGNIELLRDHLGRDARRVKFVDSTAWYTEPAAALDAYRVFSTSRLADGGADWVRILGEPVWPGRSDSEVRLWTRYESLVNLVFAAWPVTVFCPYDERSVNPDVLREARLTHPHTVGPEGVTSSAEYADPGEFVLGPE